MALFAKKIIITQDGIPEPAPKIQQPAQAPQKTSVKGIQCGEFINLSKLKDEVQEVIEPVTSVDISKAVPISLPNVAAVKHPDFVHKPSDYLHHMLTQTNK